MFVVGVTVRSGSEDFARVYRGRVDLGGIEVDDAVFWQVVVEIVGRGRLVMVVVVVVDGRTGVACTRIGLGVDVVDVFLTTGVVRVGICVDNLSWLEYVVRACCGVDLFFELIVIVDCCLRGVV